MIRRSFLAGLPALGSLSILRSSVAAPNRSNMKISGLDIRRLEATREYIEGIDGQHQVRPLHIYPKSCLGLTCPPDSPK